MAGMASSSSQQPQKQQYQPPIQHRTWHAKREPDTPIAQLTRWLIANQCGLAANMFALLFLTHTLFPQLRVYTTKFFTHSYYNPATNKYNIGQDDYCLVFSLIVLFSGLRAGIMEYVMAPYARSRGLFRKAAVRFSEQAWLVLVYVVFLPAGLYLYSTSSYFLSLENLWTHWPSREMPWLLKTYIVVQMAFWMQQIIVINIEERRKDHWQMLTHHFITVALIVASYCYRHTPVANLILVLMDIGDFFLPLAKCQKYLGYTNLCDYTFGAFMLGWFVPRQIFFSMVCYSVWSQTPHVMPVGCFRGGPAAAVDPLSTPVAADAVSPLAASVGRLLPFLSTTTSNKLAFLVEPLIDSDGAICYNDAVRWSFLSLLLTLLLLICVWFTMVVHVAIRVVRGSGADDVRSDGEEEGEEDMEEEGEKGTEKTSVAANIVPLEEEVGVEALDLKGWERRSGVRRAASSTTTGVSLPGHSDRKELLGRIGCEKHVD